MTASVVFALFATMTLMALGFPEKARLMPLMVGIPGTLLGLFQLFVEWREASRQEIPVGDPDALVREREMFVWMLTFFAGILALGFVVAAPALVFAFLRLSKRESVTVSVVSAAATWAVLFGLF
ncbi:MAG: hypothetical protein GWN29_02565, partial [Gammaproteobacteria bacterium]|nr:hypothetical protein [Gammaproteobacteria bacterium]